MCIRVTEIYAVCRCVYYVHGVDQCGSFGSPGHYIEDRSVLVGHSCPAHAASYNCGGLNMDKNSSYHRYDYDGYDNDAYGQDNDDFFTRRSASGFNTTAITSSSSPYNMTKEHTYDSACDFTDIYE